MWVVLGPGLEPVSAALETGFLTVAHQGNPGKVHFWPFLEESSGWPVSAFFCGEECGQRGDMGPLRLVTLCTKRSEPKRPCCPLLPRGPWIRSQAQGMMKTLSCVSLFLRLKPRVVPGYVSNTGKESPLGPRKKINLSLKAKVFFLDSCTWAHTWGHKQTFFFLAKAHGRQGLSSLSGMKPVPPCNRSAES